MVRPSLFHHHWLPCRLLIWSRNHLEQQTHHCRQHNQFLTIHSAEKTLTGAGILAGKGQILYHIVHSNPHFASNCPFFLSIRMERGNLVGWQFSRMLRPTVGHSLHSNLAAYQLQRLSGSRHISLSFLINNLDTPQRLPFRVQLSTSGANFL